MKPGTSPYEQILRALWRSLGTQGSRWLYVALASCLSLTLAGSGIALEWDAVAFMKAVAGFFALSLQIAWVYAVTVLMRLNHSNASTTVPGYTRSLRVTALAVWLGVCGVTGLTGLLDGGSWGNVGFLSFLAGAFMLLISTPLRWPMRWFVFLLALVYLARNLGTLIELPWTKELVRSPSKLALLATIVFAGMAWLATRFIAPRGSLYSNVFSRYWLMENAQRGVPTPAALPLASMDPMLRRLFKVRQWLQWPWSQAMRRAMSAPKPGAHHIFARAQLGLGASVHWAMQLSAMALLLLLGVLLPALYFGADGDGLHAFLQTHALLIAMVGLMIAVFPVMALPESLRTQAEAQKLMVLLPGMPQGTMQNRLLAKRYGMQALVAWLLATGVALALPYTAKDGLLACLFYIGTFFTLPYVIRDWSRIAPPNATRAVVELCIALWAPAAAYVALQWLHASMSLVLLIALALNLFFLYTRWSRIAHYPQAMPAGRLDQ